jgi:hypothetical protein
MRREIGQGSSSLAGSACYARGRMLVVGASCVRIWLAAMSVHCVLGCGSRENDDLANVASPGLIAVGEGFVFFYDGGLVHSIRRVPPLPPLTCAVDRRTSRTSLSSRRTALRVAPVPAGGPNQ